MAPATYRAPWGRYDLVREGVLRSLDRPASYVIVSGNVPPADYVREAGEVPISNKIASGGLVASWVAEVNAYSTNYLKDPKPWPTKSLVALPNASALDASGVSPTDGASATDASTSVQVASSGSPLATAEPTPSSATSAGTPPTPSTTSARASDGPLFGTRGDAEDDDAAEGPSAGAVAGPSAGAVAGNRPAPSRGWDDDRASGRPDPSSRRIREAGCCPSWALGSDTHDPKCVKVRGFAYGPRTRAEYDAMYKDLAGHRHYVEGKSKEEAAAETRALLGERPR